MTDDAAACEVCRKAKALSSNDVCWPCLSSIIDERKQRTAPTSADAATVEGER